MASYTWNDERDLVKTGSLTGEKDDTLAAVYAGATIGHREQGFAKTGSEKRPRLGLPRVDYGGVAIALWRVWLALAVTAVVVIDLLQPHLPADLKSLMSSMQQGSTTRMPFVGSNPGAQWSPMGGGFPALGGLPSGTFGPFANSR